MHLTLDVVSDVVCPWCFVGKRQLAKAMKQLVEARPGVTVAVRWLPFFLNPDTPPKGEPYRAFLEKKFGGAVAVNEMQEQVAEAGKAAGVGFAFDRISMRPNTLDAHRLIYRAQLPDSKIDAAVLCERIFSGYFQEGLDIGDADTLARLSAEAGDDPAAAQAFIGSNQGTQEVLQIAEQISNLGIRGVPFFILGRRVALSGAQPPNVLLEAMQRALDENAAEAGSAAE